MDFPGGCTQVSEGLGVRRPFPQRVMDEVGKKSAFRVNMKKSLVI